MGVGGGAHKSLKISPPPPAPLPSDLLRLWHEKNHHWLEMSDVHRETTNRVRITVMPFFMGSRQVQQSTDYWWRYVGVAWVWCGCGMGVGVVWVWVWHGYGVGVAWVWCGCGMGVGVVWGQV